MKSTLRNIFHSPRFVVGFVIFMAMVLTVLIYPYFVPRDPLVSIGKGFLAPGTYLSVYDANNTSTYRIDLPEAAANRMGSLLTAEDRKTMLDFLTVMGADTEGLDLSDDSVNDLIALWKSSYDEENVRTSKYEGFSTKAQPNKLKRLDTKLSGSDSAGAMTVVSGEGDAAESRAVADTDYVKVNEVANALNLPLGTDNFGRDMLTELVSATGTSLIIGLIAGYLI